MRKSRYESRRRQAIPGASAAGFRGGKGRETLGQFVRQIDSDDPRTVKTVCVLLRLAIVVLALGFISPAMGATPGF